MTIVNEDFYIEAILTDVKRHWPGLYGKVCVSNDINRIDFISDPVRNRDERKNLLNLIEFKGHPSYDNIIRRIKEIEEQDMLTWLLL